MLALKAQGFVPDAVIAHPGWGESLFVKEVWPTTRLAIYCEFFYHPHGADVGFDLEFPAADPEGDACRLRLKNVNHLLHFDLADAAISPTRWLRPRISDADWQRVHFLGNIPYQHFLPLLQLSTVHVYLTYPFVLSWSLLEAMSAGCAIVASDTQPLHEAITHDKTGRLVNFFDAAGLANEICALLDDPAARQRLGANARAFAQAHYDLKRVCLPRQLEWVQRLGS